MHSRHFALFALFVAAEALAVPATVPHQGRLFDAGGAPLTGDDSVEFRLYASASATSASWTETQTVSFDEGYFSVVLGSTSPIDLTALADGAWLEILVDGSAVGDRIAVGSTPYALMAGNAMNVSGGTVNATSITVNGNTIVGSDGTVPWSRISGAPSASDTLAALNCSDGQFARFTGSAWACGTINAADINGTLGYNQLPVGSSANTVAAGDHTHDAAAILTGTIATARLPLADISAAAANAAATTPAPAWLGSCKLIKDENAEAPSGFYTIDPDGHTGTVEPYTTYCNMTDEGGGWTRVITLTTPAAFTSLDSVPNAQEFVNNGTFLFSKTQLKASNREVLIVETVAPFRMHKYDFKLGTNPTGEDFVGTLMGDRAANVAVWNWTTGAWVSGGNGNCNTNNHSQWNCTPPNGVRFHYSTRNWAADGGSSVATGWDWFTGYATGYGDVAALVKNWNGQFNKTAHDIYVR